MTQDTAPAAGPAGSAAVSADGQSARHGSFVITKEHRRFAEFADAVRRNRYIGLCYGPPGVGKSLSAWEYAGWATVGPYLEAFRLLDAAPVPEQALESRTIIYTPKVYTARAPWIKRSPPCPNE
jgi:hypothetical protein